MNSITSPTFWRHSSAWSAQTTCSTRDNNASNTSKNMLKQQKTVYYIYYFYLLSLSVVPHCRNFSVRVTNHCICSINSKPAGKKTFLPVYFTLSFWRCLIRWKWNMSIINIKVLFFPRLMKSNYYRHNEAIVWYLLPGKHPAVLHVSIHRQNCLERKRFYIIREEKLSQTRMCSGSWRAGVNTCVFLSPLKGAASRGSCCL